MQRQKPSILVTRNRIVSAISMRNEAIEIDADIRRWKATLGGASSVRVQVIRVTPEEWAGRKIGGTIGHYDELPEVETIRDDFGGGTYRLVVKRPNRSGRLVYARGGCTTVKITGDPLMPANAPPAESRARRDLVRNEIEAVVNGLVEHRLRDVENEMERMRRELLHRKSVESP